MWTIEDLHKAVARRNENLQLAPDVERVILAAERASGRTEETYGRDTASKDLAVLLKTLSPDKVPQAIRDAYPALRAAKGKQLAPPMPLKPGFDPAAVLADIRNQESTNKVGDARQPQKPIRLEPDPVNGRDRARSGPSR